MSKIKNIGGVFITEPIEESKDKLYRPADGKTLFFSLVMYNFGGSFMEEYAEGLITQYDVPNLKEYRDVIRLNPHIKEVSVDLYNYCLYGKSFEHRNATISEIEQIIDDDFPENYPGGELRVLPPEGENRFKLYPPAQEFQEQSASHTPTRMEGIIMSYGRTKPSNEPQNAEKITEELSQCVKLQETMKEVNAYWRKHGTCVGAPGITEAQAAKLDNKIATSQYSWERQQPFASYDLTNNNSQIKRLEKKLAEVSRGFEGWEFDGGHAEANTEDNRLQLFFDERPNDQQRAVLKANGFKWAPTQEAWQRQLTDNAIYSAGRIEFIKPSDGRTVREHQPGRTGEQDAQRPTSPKPPARDDGAR